MIRAVLDTNVLASAVVGRDRPHSLPAEVVRAWKAGRFLLVTSAVILGELERTFAKPYFARVLPPATRSEAMAAFRSSAVVVASLPPIEAIAAHPEDDLVAATAVAGDADFVVTGDRAFLKRRGYREIRFVSASEFLEILTT